MCERDHESPILLTSNRNDPISRRTLDWLMKTYGAEAKILPEKQHFHVLKHNIAMHLLDAGGICAQVGTGAWSGPPIRARYSLPLGVSSA